LVKRAHKTSAEPLVNAALSKLAGAPELMRPATLTPQRVTAELTGELARFYAHPTWLVERWLAQFGAERTRLIC